MELTDKQIHQIGIINKMISEGKRKFSTLIIDLSQPFLEQGYSYYLIADLLQKNGLNITELQLAQYVFRAKKRPEKITNFKVPEALKNTNISPTLKSENIDKKGSFKSMLEEESKKLKNQNSDWDKFADL